MVSSPTRTHPAETSRTTQDSKDRRSNESHATTNSTAPTSYEPSSPRPSGASGPKFQACAQEHYDEDLSPATSLHPRSSVETYASTTASAEELDGLGDDEYEDNDDGYDGSALNSSGRGTAYAYVDAHIPKLGPYRRTEAAEPDVRPSTPQEFAHLFPSLNRFTIRHDDFTRDGNMQLRVDTVVPVAAGRRGHQQRRRAAMQLFHLRMHSLEERRFSLRRYCRESGREVCNSQRVFAPAAGEEAQEQHKLTKKNKNPDGRPEAPPRAAEDGEPRPGLRRSMTSALKTLSSPPKPGSGGGIFRRTNSAGNGSIFGSTKTSSRPSTATASPAREQADDYFADSFQKQQQQQQQHPAAPPRRRVRALVPTNTIKLEFANYARVDVTRRGSGGLGLRNSNKRYDFTWWGHTYSWRRVIHEDKRANGNASGPAAASFQLIRDGREDVTVAQIVPEVRTRAQMAEDEQAGGWVPPSYMWIDDESVLEAVTDVADVIMATGLIALVDNCIKERWQSKRKMHRIPVPLTSKTVDVEYVGPRALAQLFGRRGLQSTPTSPLGHAKPISAY